MIEYASERARARAGDLAPALFELLTKMAQYCHGRGKKLVVTETVSTLDEDILLGRSSPSHREKRAADIRTRDWDQDFVKEFVGHFTKFCGHIGAISSSDGQRRLIVDKSTTRSPHLHVQVSREHLPR
jgi:hypothetical protein